MDQSLTWSSTLYSTLLDLHHISGWCCGCAIAVECGASLIAGRPVSCKQSSLTLFDAHSHTARLPRSSENGKSCRRVRYSGYQAMDMWSTQTVPSNPSMPTVALARALPLASCSGSAEWMGGKWAKYITHNCTPISYLPSKSIGRVGSSSVIDAISKIKINDYPSWNSMFSKQHYDFQLKFQSAQSACVKGGLSFSAWKYTRALQPHMSRDHTLTVRLAHLFAK